MHPSERLATLRTLHIAVGQLCDQAKTEVKQIADETHASRWDHPHGRVRLQGGKPTPGFDEAALLAWVRDNRPDQIVEQVNPAYKRALLARLRIAGDVVVDAKTGEVVPFAAPATSTPSVVVDYDRESTVVDDTTEQMSQQLDAIVATLHAGEK